jgi:uncharacterized protein involved in tellurium resistance
MRTIFDEEDLGAIYDSNWFEKQKREERHNNRLLILAFIFAGASLFGLGLLLGRMQ